MSSLKVQENSYKNSESWTDDLPVCKNTGIGFSTNQIYREDSQPQEEHPYEDCSSHFRFSNDFYWYAVFDGHEGKRAADFCSQRMIVEVYFSQINEKQSDEEVRELMRQAFSTVEAGYMETLGDTLAERTSLWDDYEISDGMNSYEAYKKSPALMEKIKSLNCQLASGSAAAVSLIYKNKLYVGNVGNCRVLLCQTDANSVLKVVQLSIDHDLKNEDELLRLSQIGINSKLLRHSSRLGNQENTRCLGNYAVKGGYKEFDDLASASQEPVIAEPDIHGGIILDESCRFLLLMTAGLYKCVEEAIGPDQVNKYIAQCVVEQFREQATLTGVAQAVVDKVVRLHHDWFMSNSINFSCPPKREDITLVLRNFNFPMPNGIKSPTKPTVQFNPAVVSNEINDNNYSLQNTLTNVNTNSTVSRTNTTSSSDAKPGLEDEIGPDQRISAHVDFSEFYRNFEKAKRDGTLPSCLL
ncbi:TGF-beta-activated kinase 1 and MAP3K7-binding protein 1-like [Euwallacea fornicatus]|uniref:TGF-beta-activated kinase 1 and MAP3K7-binding protein 1-like n=1 Tax=Euwallacea fornicatus TaxID=995702 RepID=UPI00338D706F